MRYVNKIKVSANITLRRYRKGIPSITNHGSRERDTIHLDWVKDLNSKEMETLRFARLVLILAQLPFVLETCSASINILTTTGTSILKQLTLLKLICTSLIWLQGE